MRIFGDILCNIALANIPLGLIPYIYTLHIYLTNTYTSYTQDIYLTSTQLVEQNCFRSKISNPSDPWLHSGDPETW